MDIASTHEPPSIAAGCILLVANMYNININKKHISEIFDISDVTISKTYRKIYPFHKIIINNKVTEMVLQKKNALVNVDKDELSEENLIAKEKFKIELLQDIENIDDSSDSEYLESENKSSSIEDSEDKKYIENINI